MHLARHRPPYRPLVRVLLLVALAVASLTLNHCRNVSDSLNGVGVSLFRSSDCFAQCAATYNAQIKVEQTRHKQEIDRCQALGGSAKSACLAAEDARHDAAVATIQANRLTCQNNCHHQGSGGTSP